MSTITMPSTSTSYGPFRVHPMLDLFPATLPDDFAFLVESIRQGGVRVPVLVDHEGRTLLHGRARVLATIAAGRDPTLVPRRMISAGVRHEAVLDVILSGVLDAEGHHVSGVAFLDHVLSARPFYDAAALRRARFGAPRPYLVAVPARQHVLAC